MKNVLTTEQRRYRIGNVQTTGRNYNYDGINKGGGEHGVIKSKLPIIMAKNGIRTIEDLRERTGISRTTLTAIYYGKGKGVQFQTLGKLCKVLKVDVGDIFEIEKNVG